MNAKNRILDNLAGRVHGVNMLVATHGLTWDEARPALEELRREGFVRCTNFDNVEGMGLYQLTLKGHNRARPPLNLVVDNTTKV